MFSKLQTSSDGLSTAEATARLQTYGPNELIMAKRAGPLYVFLSQFKSPMVIVLLAAIVVSVLVSILAGSEEDRGLVDAAVIAIIVVANAVLGFIQEYRSERALEALRKMATPTARVVRNGQVSEVDSRELVPGDLIVVESGDRIPADARVIRSIGFTVDESILTGESQPVSKTESPMSSRNVPIGLLKNMIFQSTMAVSGKCQAVVVTTGMKTEFGRIAQSVQQFEEITTPLQEDLDEMGKKLGVAVIVLAAIILSAEVLRDVSGSLVEEMMTAIALAVSAIPEGLPAVVTITLAIGVQRMVQKNALVRRLSSVETLGSTTVICSDKTGTITKNEMTVTVVYADGRIIDVTGTGYQQDGEFLLDGKKIDPLARPTLRQLLLIGQLCNNSALQVDHSKTGGFVPVGDPTEAALLVLAEKGGLHRGETIGKYTEVHELSFDSIRKRMTSILVTPAGERYAFTKGAPELLLPLCDRMLHDGRMTEMTNEVRDSILRTNAELARKALRLLALAYRPLGDDVSDYTPEHVERNMVFVGLVGMIDPPRNEVPQAVDLCKKAGIRVMMMTGD
ncbi:MAG: HAD-IC family P-type ATPase, partial [Candidatus Thorarchaeota archaeon]